MPADIDYNVDIVIAGREKEQRNWLIHRYKPSDLECVTSFNTDFKYEENFQIGKLRINMRLYESRMQDILDSIDNQKIGIIIVIDLADKKTLKWGIKHCKKIADNNLHRPVMIACIKKGESTPIHEEDVKEQFTTIFKEHSHLIKIKTIAAQDEKKRDDKEQNLIKEFTEFCIKDMVDINENSKSTKLIELIQKICKDKQFWEDKVRCISDSNNPFPAGVKHLSRIITNKPPSNKKTLEAIANLAEAKYSVNFQWAHSLFRGRSTETNRFYAIISKLNDRVITENNKTTYYTYIDNKIIDRVYKELDNFYSTNKSSEKYESPRRAT